MRGGDYVPRIGADTVFGLHGINTLHATRETPAR